MPQKERSQHHNTSPVSKETRATRRAKRAQHSADEQTYHDCLAQADICREQAREAANMHRFKAAAGLFATAQSLCQRAIVLHNGPAPEAHERLSQLTVEMQMYRDLAKSMERPLLSRAVSKLQKASLKVATTSHRIPST